MADSDDDAVAELYKLKQCTYCKEEFPAVSFYEHQQFYCKAKPGNLSSEELAFMYEVQADTDINWDAALDDEENTELFEETPCKICGTKFPKISIVKHQAKCSEFLEQQSIAAECERLNFEEVPCKICGSTFPKISIIKHEAKCNQFIEQQSIAAEYERLNREKSAKDTDQKTSKKDSSDNYTKVTESPKIGIKTTPPADKVEKRIESIQSESFSPRKTEQFKLKENKIEEMFPKVQVPKMPKISLLDCIDQTDTEDLNNLSDEDCGESLEEFWNRARDLLQRRRQQNF